MGLPQKKETTGKNEAFALAQVTKERLKAVAPTEKPSTAPAQPTKKQMFDPIAYLVDWRRHVSLKAYLSVVVFIAIVSASLLAGAYAFQLQYSKALEDTWAIMYLDGERLANRISEELRTLPYRYTTKLKNSERITGKLKTPDAIFRIEDERVAVPLALSKVKVDSFNAASIGLEQFSFPAKFNVVKINNSSFIVRQEGHEEVAKVMGRPFVKGNYLMAWYVRFPKLVGPAKGETISYFVTRGGKLIYTTSRSEVDENTLTARPLVQRFIDSRLKTAQIEFDNFGTSSYGFYHELPGTNLVMFSETAKFEALSAIWNAAQKFLFVLIVILISAVFLVQLPITSVIRPIGELVYLSREVARGNFRVAAKSRGFGEVVTLTRAFSSMAKNLILRDQSIHALMLEQQTKIALEQEISLATTLQENLLPKSALVVEAGLSMTSVYIPATHVAGDWYTYHYAEETGETIIVLVDVSGHGMAASLFTAVIAGIFYEIRDDKRVDFPMLYFAQKLNRRIHQFGSGSWHATMQVVRYMKGSSELEILNCGHTFPLLVSPDKSNKKNSRVIRMPSEPLGLVDEVQSSIHKIKLKAGDTMIMYTDGIIESKNREGKIYGTKRLFNLGQEVCSKPTHEIVSAILKDCEVYRAGKPADDDICLLSIRIGS